MTVRATLAAGDAAPLPDTSAIPAFILAAPQGTAGNVYQFNTGADVGSTIGYSDGEEDVYWFLRNAKQPCVVGLATVTDGALSSVTHTGSGPAVTAALTGSLTGPLMATTGKFKVTTGGANGTAVLGYYLDGSGDFGAYTAQVPQENPPVLRGKIDLSGITLSTLATKHLDFTAPAALVVTWTSPATVQDIADQFNAQAIASPSVLRARIYQDATGSYLEIYTTSLGTTVTETIDAAASDADTILGFTASSPSNLTATGTAATLVLPYAGYTLTFPSGTYVLGDTYAITTTGPTASAAAIQAAATAVRNSGYPFGYMLPLVVPSSATNARSICDMQDALVASWDSDANRPIYELQLTPGPFHTASSSPTTNNTNITANDQALVSAMSGNIGIGTVIPDDGYRNGTKLVGRYRRPAALGVAYMMSAFKLSDDPGAATHRAIPEWSLTAPDGVTLARNEADPRIVVHLGGTQGPGFTVLQDVGTGPRVKHGVTRAGPTSRLVELGPGLRMGRRGQAVVYHTAITAVENETFPTDAAGILLEGVRNALVGLFETDLDAALLTPPFNNNASSVTVTIDDTEIIQNTRNVTVTAILQKLSDAENVTIAVLVTGTNVQPAALTG